MSWGSDHIEDASYHNVCSAPTLSCYMAQFSNFVGYEPEEAADIGMQHHVGMSNMAQAPKVLATENESVEQPLVGTSQQSAQSHD